MTNRLTYRLRLNGLTRALTRHICEFKERDSYCYLTDHSSYAGGSSHA